MVSYILASFLVLMPVIFRLSLSHSLVLSHNSFIVVFTCVAVSFLKLVSLVYRIWCTLCFLYLYVWYNIFVSVCDALVLLVYIWPTIFRLLEFIVIGYLCVLCLRMTKKINNTDTSDKNNKNHLKKHLPTNVFPLNVSFCWFCFCFCFCLYRSFASVEFYFSHFCSFVFRWISCALFRM